jgi:lantibiotic modifying enzyme
VYSCHLAGPLPATLFSGAAGVGLFLSALARVSKRPVDRERALDALVPARRIAAALRAAPSRDDEILRVHWGRQLGAAEGVAGAAYGLACAARLLDAPELLDDVRVLASLLTPARVPGGAALMNGASGIVLVLLALDLALPNEGFVDRAKAHAASIIDALSADARVSTDDGMAFGRAGLATALARLFRATRDERWLDAAQRAIPSACAVDGSRDRSWRAGAAGIVLAHAELAHATGDVDRLVAVSHDARLGDADDVDIAHDSLCSGGAGIAEVAWDVGRAAALPELVDAASRRGARLVERFETTGEFSLGWGNGFPHFGFFQGMTGVGYALLRMTHPRALPCVLSLGDAIPAHAP